MPLHSRWVCFSFFLLIQILLKRSALCSENSRTACIDFTSSLQLWILLRSSLSAYSEGSKSGILDCKDLCFLKLAAWRDYFFPRVTPYIFYVVFHPRFLPDDRGCEEEADPMANPTPPELRSILLQANKKPCKILYASIVLCLNVTFIIVFDPDAYRLLTSAAAAERSTEDPSRQTTMHRSAFLSAFCILFTNVVSMSVRIDCEHGSCPTTLARTGTTPRMAGASTLDTVRTAP